MKLSFKLKVVFKGSKPVAPSIQLARQKFKSFHQYKPAVGPRKIGDSKSSAKKIVEFLLFSQNSTPIEPISHEFKHPGHPESRIGPRTSVRPAARPQSATSPTIILSKNTKFCPAEAFELICEIRRPSRAHPIILRTRSHFLGVNDLILQCCIVNRFLQKNIVVRTGLTS